jgi:AraC-like DNA-binding protein
MCLIDLDPSDRAAGSERVESSAELAHRYRSHVGANLLAHPRLRKLIEYLELHPSRRLTTAAAARVVCFQENYFCALFKRETGYTFVSWQRTWRVSRIAEALLSEPISISRTAEHYGYVSMRTFERAFKSVYHVSAREFRRAKQRATAEHESKCCDVNSSSSGTCSELCVPSLEADFWSNDPENHQPLTSSSALA